MAFLMYMVASRYSLRDAALIGAAAGLVLYAVQFVLDRTLARKIDLTGGLAGFGILMLLLSAGFAWIVQNELIIQLKGSVIGLICAAIFALDAALGGRYLGERMVRYITFVDLDPKRFVMASAITSLVLALINVAIALGLSRDTWIFYRYWLQPVLGAGLTFWGFRFARRNAPAPA